LGAVVSRLPCHGHGTRYALNAGQGHLKLLRKRGFG